MAKDDQLTSRESADIVGCSVTTLSRAVASGELTPARRISSGRYGTFLFHRNDIVRFAKTWNARNGKAAS
jgi:hypothetical protein